MKTNNTLRHLLPVCAVMAITANSLHAVDGTWTGDTNTNSFWTNSALWNGTTIADGTDSTAFFTNNITGARTISLNGVNRTIGNITFTDSTPSHNLLITGNILTLDRTGVGVSSPLIDVTQSGRTLQIDSQISGDDGLTKTGAGILILRNNSNNYTGKTVVNGGILQIGTAYNNGEVSIPGGYTSNPVTGSNLELNGGIVSYWFDFNRSLGTGDGQIQITGGVSGFTQKQGDRTNLTFGTAATTVVWGSTSFNPTTLVLNDDAAGAANTITFNNLLNLSGADRTIATNSATRGAVMNNVISNSTGTAGLIKTGVGNLSLNATNTYNGATLISAGTLSIGNGGTTGALSTSSVITTDATLAFNRTDTLTQGTNFAAGILGTGGVTQASTGTTFLSGTNSYAGNTRGNAGILLATVATALPGYNTAGKVIFNGGTIGARVGGAGWTTGEVDTLLANATKTSGALGIDTTNGPLSQWTPFLGGAGNLGALGLTKIGSNALTLDQANTYTGATRVNGGTLTAGIATVTGVSGAFGINSAVTTDNVSGASINLAGFNTQIGSLAGGGTTGGHLTLGGATLTVGANNTTTTFSGTITGNGNIVKIGTGALTLGNNSTSYNGTTTINGGRLDFGGIANANIGGGSGRNITVASGAVVRFNTLSNTLLNRIVETTDEIGVMTGTTGENFNFSSSVGATLPNAFLGNWAGNGAKAEISGTITPGSDGYKFGAIGSSGNLGIRGTLTGNNTLTVGQTGASGVRVTVVAANDFTGQTVINAGARLALGNNLALQNSALNVGSAGGNIGFNEGTAGTTITGNTLVTSPTFGGLIGSRNLSSVFTNASSNNENNYDANFITGFTLNVADGNTFTYSGAIGGFGTGTTNNAGGGTGGNSTLTKTGLGTQILSGVNTYIGVTTVSAGTLLINGSGSTSAGSAVTVNGGAIGGTGSILSTLNLSAGSFHVVDLFDALIVSGAVSIYSGFGVDNLVGLDWSTVDAGTYTLINGTLGSGVFSGLDHNSLVSAYDAGFGRTAYFKEGSLQLVVDVIPEPSVALLSGLGLLALFRRRRA